MFQNSYQNGGYFDFFDPKGKCFFDCSQPRQAKASHEACEFTCDLQGLRQGPQKYPLTNLAYVIEALTSNAKLQFPR